MMIVISLIFSPILVLRFPRDLQKVTIWIGFECCFSLWECIFLVNRVWFSLSVFTGVSPCLSDHDGFNQFQSVEGIEHSFCIIMLSFDRRTWDPCIVHSWRINESIQENIWPYWFQSKIISLPWTIISKHVISCDGSICDGLRCNGWIASNDFL